MANRPTIHVTTTVAVIHRVLVPGGEVFYVYGYLAHSTELPDVPLMLAGPGTGGHPAYVLHRRALVP